MAKKKNPLMLDAYVWYPDGLHAYHTLFGREPAKIFRNVLKDGEILSANARGASREPGSNFMVEDIAAGDDNYVFLSIGVPYGAGQNTGYAFVFDPYELAEDGDLVGARDIINIYEKIANDFGINFMMADEVDEYLEMVEQIQEGFRYEGPDGVRWLKALEEGRLDEDLVQDQISSLKAVFGQFNPDTMERFIDRVPGTALLNGEILVRDVLPLYIAEGVIYDKIWFEMDDFKQLIGDRPPPIPKKDRYKGFPYRCPYCDLPVVSGKTLGTVLKKNPWVRAKVDGDWLMVIECNQCHAKYKIHWDGKTVYKVE